ncbi:hypothetical protein B0H16DRAFT_1470230 [Mycena metata]|uniref:Uncharacterized protein n=1 Tax=Mycena metata TaxID=1033252 RepID=A0AAD7HVA8_9AGAR|nr:hypothetical protein B0H16DRAFT_1470230 [Mycena metata]
MIAVKDLKSKSVEVPMKICETIMRSHKYLESKKLEAEAGQFDDDLLRGTNPTALRTRFEKSKQSEGISKVSMRVEGVDTSWEVQGYEGEGPRTGAGYTTVRPKLEHRERGFEGFRRRESGLNANSRGVQTQRGLPEFSESTIRSFERTLSCRPKELQEAEGKLVDAAKIMPRIVEAEIQSNRLPQQLAPEARNVPRELVELSRPERP